jgi:hypothetical protein
MIERADSLREALGEAPELATLPNVTRSDVLRLAVLRGLDTLEREYEAIVDEGLVEVAEERAAAKGRLAPLSEVKARLGL